MRGKARHWQATPMHRRITPAYAGKSQRIWLQGAGGQDHPRLCGEKQENARPESVQKGSPPPMRGKVPFYVLVLLIFGITPAYAGKSPLIEVLRGLSEDHPRLCGEKRIRGRQSRCKSGSPPPMRGKALVPVQTSPILRITPAYAGKRVNSDGIALYMTDHPRLCGEKSFRNAEERFHRGSPPPMRGKDSVFSDITCVWGITPAYAGKSAVSSAVKQKIQDHPRLCGEKRLNAPWSGRTPGSPPPMRGKVSQPKSMNLLTGITPAYAGKSVPSSFAPPCIKDHPRLCGEK